MAMVVVDDSCLQADSQPKSGGLVWGLTAACALFYIHQMNRVNSRNDLWSWWQHYKHRHGYYYYYYPVAGWSNHSPEQTFPGMLPVWNSLPQNLSIFKSRLKTFFIHSGFHWTLIRSAASASKATTIWCYINFIIINLLLLLKVHSVSKK